MNFVYISPNFPDVEWKFCAALKREGVNVLGIGDQPYEELVPELKAALTEYYKVSNLTNYDEVYRGVAYFIHKHGRVDWLESNNEFWLEQDARLRTDFNICSGMKTDSIMRVKEKSQMKQIYQNNNIRTARQIKASAGLEAVKRFADEACYPVFAKPDNGVGANGAFKINNEQELEEFFKDSYKALCYVIEEYITGNICTYDAIIDSHGNPIHESMCVCPPSISDIVTQNLDSTYYVEKNINENLRFWGRQTVKAFGVKSRFVHFEFFQLQRQHKGLGEPGDFVALEVNMRPGGGYTPDMINHAHSVDVYRIWAEMIAYDQRRLPDPHDDYYCVFAGRRDGVKYRIDHDGMMKKYAASLKQWDRVADAMAPAMGNQSYIARFRTAEEMNEFLHDIYDRI